MYTTGIAAVMDQNRCPPCRTAVSRLGIDAATTGQWRSARAAAVKGIAYLVRDKDSVRAAVGLPGRDSIIRSSVDGHLRRNRFMGWPQDGPHHCSEGSHNSRYPKNLPERLRKFAPLKIFHIAYPKTILPLVKNTRTATELHSAIELDVSTDSRRKASN